MANSENNWSEGRGRTGDTKVKQSLYSPITATLVFRMFILVQSGHECGKYLSTRSS